LQRAAEIGAEGFDLTLHGGHGCQSVGIVRTRGNRVDANREQTRFGVGDSGHGVQEEPFAQADQRRGRQRGEAKAGTSGGVDPNHRACGVNGLFALRQIETQTDRLIRFERHMTLNRDTLFADVDDLMQIEQSVVCVGSESSVGGSLDLMADTTATVG